MSNNTNLSEVEIVKDKSNYLRGTIEGSLTNEITGALYADDTHLIKFHGSYQQADRDLDSERKRQKLEPLYSFMIRVRVPGGIATPKQWLVMDNLADQYGSGTLKLTTRQAFQLHGVMKRNLKQTIKGFNTALLDSIAGCGDVVRNVMSNPNPHQSAVHGEVYEISKRISEHFTPRTRAYYELWLNDELVGGGEPESEPNPEDEPIYGKTYLPRKFKIALAIPPHNDTDIFANDIGLIAIERDGKLLGFNVAAGGGLGMTFGMPDTYPRLADVSGFCTTEQVLDVIENIVLIQRDLGNRENRKFSRLKYTIDQMGLDAFKTELHNRLGYTLADAEPYTFTSNGDAYGWQKGKDGKWNLTLFIEGGRVVDTEQYKLRSGLRDVAAFLRDNNGDGDFRLTGNQNVMICNVAPKNKARVQAILEHYGILAEINKTGLRLNSLACVALNTCTLAFAEAERYLPSLIDKLDVVIRESGLERDAIVIRMTGCPNGCARPYLGEIAFVGRALGRYNLYLGAGFAGERLNKLYKEMLNEEEIVAELTPIIHRYAQERTNGERFGDFVIRAGYVTATTHGTNFHH